MNEIHASYVNFERLSRDIERYVKYRMDCDDNETTNYTFTEWLDEGMPTDSTLRFVYED